ncbi:MULTISPECIES: DUF397 domain-containing protein [unclassified Streptomyces]|uniref:DUF397 domain-containing protein n=1 Tax=unclassified Streptomyces TaxID=2593676 RepID=UPI00093942A5|nr:DUF397 domain-containing protein [Streptomyces sp. CB02058]OKI97297.1 toxin-antitoxin system, toxin component [Streptomyces sp. CB02058]
MSVLAWQKSSYCAQGNSCVHIAADHGSVALTESSDPTGAILRTSPSAWAALIRAVKETHDRG